MQVANRTVIFRQIHIDVARNATDDFNLFHDKTKWNQVSCNPFGGTIVLGFQLELLIEYQIRRYREFHGEDEIITRNELNFSNYDFMFLNAVRPDREAMVTIGSSELSDRDSTVLSNRINLKSEGKLDLTGYKRESKTPLFMPDFKTPDWGDLHEVEDRSYLSGSDFFVKRKFMNTSNAKNFLTGSLAEQSDYFDELDDIAHFPEMFPCGLISCALLEKMDCDGHDFKQDPLVYTSHKISIDRRCLARLKSNDALHLLVREKDEALPWASLSNADKPKALTKQGHSGQHLSFECIGIMPENKILFRALISLRPL